MGAARPLAAALLLMLGFGGVHAFSLFLAPVEQTTGASRGAVSSVYGLALGALTAAYAIGAGMWAALLGFGIPYGAHIAAFPAAIRRMFGAESFAWAYGRVFTAWGAAGILARWLAGALYGVAMGYTWAFELAALAASLGLALNATLPRDGVQPDLRRLG